MFNIFVQMVTDGVVDNCHSSAEEIQDFGGHRDLDTGAVINPCKKINFLV